MSAARLPTFYLSHGGGPWPYMDGRIRDVHSKLRTSLEAVPGSLPEAPAAILIVSAHWESTEFAVSSGAHPPMLYDYSGFPEHTYHVQYPAPGSPALAQRVADLLRSGGLDVRLDAQRGFDHATFCLLAPMYPNADIPVVQLGLRGDLDPDAHLRAGRQLAPLRDEGVLILGSGSSYHNLRRFDASAAAPSREFDDWLQETLVDLQPAQRRQRLLEWERAPAARVAHPREEHLLPLMVAVGAASDEAGHHSYRQRDFAGSLAMSGYRFGGNEEGNATIGKTAR